MTPGYQGPQSRVKEVVSQPFGSPDVTHRATGRNESFGSEWVLTGAPAKAVPLPAGAAGDTE